jgi:hypothetical protein
MCSCFNYPSANNRTTKTPPPLRGHSRLNQNMACMRFIMERGRPALCWWTWASRPLLVDVAESPTLLFYSAMLGSTQSLITLIAAFFIMERGRPALCWWTWASRPHSFFHSAMLGSTQSLITLIAAFFIMERGRPALCWWTWASRPHSFFTVQCWDQLSRS